TELPGAEINPDISPDGRQVLYAAGRAGASDLFLLRVGGGRAINLTANAPANNAQGAFSPDGERIAFRSDRDGGGIFVMGATGESVVRVSDFGYTPAWSPSGDAIVVGTEKIPQPSTRPTRSQVWTINVKSGERRLLTD